MFKNLPNWNYLQIFYNFNDRMSTKKGAKMEEILKRLKELRLENHISQEELSKFLNVSRTNYNRYENGVRVISVDMIIKLADFYKVSLDYLAGRNDY